MPAIVLDTGFLYSLVVDNVYSSAAREHWDGQELWVPKSVKDELTHKAQQANPGLPPELPKHALGLIHSNAWGFSVIEPTDDELKATQDLQDRLGGPGSVGHAGECEGAVLLARRTPGGLLLTDDASSIAQLNAFVTQETGSPLRYAHTTTVIDDLVTSGRMTGDERAATRALLDAKGRPLL